MLKLQWRIKRKKNLRFWHRFNHFSTHKPESAHPKRVKTRIHRLAPRLSHCISTVTVRKCSMRRAASLNKHGWINCKFLSWAQEQKCVEKSNLERQRKPEERRCAPDRTVLPLPGRAWFAVQTNTWTQNSSGISLFIIQSRCLVMFHFNWAAYNDLWVIEYD